MSAFGLGRLDPRSGVARHCGGVGVTPFRGSFVVAHLANAVGKEGREHFYALRTKGTRLRHFC